MTPVVNTMLVSMIVWGLGFVLKKIPWFRNDMIPQALYYVSLVSAYLIEILKGLGGVMEPSASMTMLYATEPPPMTVTTAADPAMIGSTAWIWANIWDWVGRKIVWEKLLRKGKKIA